MPGLNFNTMNPITGEPGNTVTLGIAPGVSLPSDKNIDSVEAFFGHTPLEHVEFSRQLMRITMVLPPNLEGGAVDAITVRLLDAFGETYEGRSPQSFTVTKKESQKQPNVTTITPMTIQSSSDDETTSVFSLRGDHLGNVTGVYFLPVPTGGARIQGRALSVTSDSVVRFSASMKRGNWRLYVASAHTPATPVRGKTIKVT